MRKRILPFIMVMLMIFTALPISASASTLYYGKTINSGETYTDTSFEMWCWYGNETFTNNGTVNISKGFTLGYQASFVNNSEFTFTGSNSTFGVSSGCSFQNNGTARISGCYNLGLEDSFVNTGTLYLSDISNFNVSGVVNTGKIVCGNGVPDRLIDALKEKSSGDGTVVKEDRSLMNVPFVTGDADLDAKFVAEAKAAGFENLKGHRTVGGMRASIYNAMPTEGVVALVDFMKKFEEENTK